MSNNARRSLEATTTTAATTTTRSPISARTHGLLHRADHERTRPGKAVHNRYHHHHARAQRDYGDPRASESSVASEADRNSDRIVSGGAPDQSQTASRRGSLRGPAAAAEDAAANARGSPPRSRTVTVAEVIRERRKNALRTTELRNELDELQRISTKTTRRLDSSYYSVLEKLGTLQSTTASLKELSAAMQTLGTDFQHDGAELVAEVDTHLAAFDRFEVQEQRIGKLAKRVDAGRQEITALTTRMGAIRAKLQYWDEAEAQWQENTRKRLQQLWVGITIAMVSVVALVVFFYSRSPRSTSTTTNTTAADAAAASVRAPAAVVHDGMVSALLEIEKARNISWEPLAEGRIAMSGPPRPAPLDEADVDPRLRLLDEL